MPKHEQLPDDQHNLMIILLHKERRDPEIMAEADHRDWRVTQRPFNLAIHGLPGEPHNIIALPQKSYIQHEDLVNNLASMKYNPAITYPQMGIYEFLLTERGRQYIQENEPQAAQHQ